MKIARRAEEIKLATLAQLLSLTVVLHPDMPVLKLLINMTGGKADDLPLDLGPIGGGDPIRVSARAVFTAVSKLQGDSVNEDFMAGSMIAGAIRIGDLIQRAGYSDKSVPLMQFARHFRNACAHGDRWHFSTGEPKHLAATRRVTLEPGMNGVRATWTTVSPREYFEFLDEVFAHFLTKSLHECMERTVQMGGTDDAALVFENLLTCTAEAGFPHENMTFLAQAAERISLQIEPWQTIIPNNYLGPHSGP